MAFAGVQGVTFKMPRVPLTCDRSSVVILRRNSVGRNHKKLSSYPLETATVALLRDYKRHSETVGLLANTLRSATVLTSSPGSRRKLNKSKDLKYSRNKSSSSGTETQKTTRETLGPTPVKCYHEKVDITTPKSADWWKSQELQTEGNKQTKLVDSLDSPVKRRKLRTTASTNKKSSLQLKKSSLKRKVQRGQVRSESKAAESPSKKEDNSQNKSEGHVQPSFSQGYVYAIHKSPLLTQEEEIELANYLKRQSRLVDIQQEMTQKLGRKLSLEEWAVRAGISVQDLHSAIMLGNNAKERLITANLRLVHAIASRFAYESNNSYHNPVQLVDLIQEGILGLIQATDKFDASYGWRFSTFATWWIRASISKYLNEYNRSVRIPAKVIALVNQSRKVATELENEKKVPSEVEVCSLLGVSSSRLRFCIEAVANQPVSLERLGELLEESGRLGKGASYCVPDTRECTEECLVERFLRADLLKVLREYLSPMEIRALLLRYGLVDGRHRSLEECGRIMSCSRERIRQLLLSGITKLRNSNVENFLKDYLH